MTHFQFKFQDSQISYYRYGSGPGVVICFHGYGENGSLFSFFEDPVGKQYSFYAIDLPFHGLSSWSNALPFTESDLSDIVLEILQRHCHSSESQLTLMGFSLGGRVALSYYQTNPVVVKKMILLAPDGLKRNFWYALATQTRPGNRLFAYSMKKPAWFFALLKGLNKMGLVNASIFKFVNYYIGNENARRSLYQRWTGLRKLKPDIAAIKALIRQHQTPVRLVYGRYDRIIIPARGEKFRKGIEQHCTIRVINSGHQVVHANHLEQLLPILSE